MKLYSNEHFILQRMRDGLTQHDIAEKLDVTQGFVAQIEGGVRNLTPVFEALYPKKLTSIKRNELVYVMLRRLGVTHTEAKKLFGVAARDWNDWISGRKRFPDNVLNYLQDQLKRK